MHSELIGFSAIIKRHEVLDANLFRTLSEVREIACA